MIDNQLYYGDNLDVLRNHIAEESVDLCYIDPPFNSKRNYNQIYNNIGTEDRAQSQAFVDTWEWDNVAEQGLQELLTNSRKLYTYQTVTLMEGLQKVLKKGSLLAYLVSMALRIAEIYRVLKPTGSFYLHCDPTASHYLKLVLDSIFCPGGGDFKNEIIWHKNSGSIGRSAYSKRHDTLLFYTKSKDYHYDGKAIGELREQNKGTFGGYFGTDEDGREYREVRKAGKIYKYYMDEPRNPEDVWDVPQIPERDKTERTGYATQKPEKLLERILLASSKKSDTVLDAYCGCGTTIAVAQRFCRKWIGIDITYASISVILERLEKTCGEKILDEIKLGGIPKDVESARALAHKKDDRTRKEFEKWAILTYSNNRAYINEKKGKDKGIDGIAKILVSTDESKEVLFSVKSGHVSSAQIRDLRGVIEREDAAIGIFITLEPPTKDMLQEAKAAGIYHNSLINSEIERIQIVSIERIIKGERMTLPMVQDVLKKAQPQAQNNQLQITE
ncbi:restriction endonuclease subunit M [Bacteroidia bacterium]|nr:restriction endonuclease subunit M [Bacteroidia bacterium]